MLKLDCSNFFPSISGFHIKDAFSNHKFLFRKPEEFEDYTHAELSTEITDMLITFTCLDYRLPQGAPTSPWLSNIVMNPVDSWINKALSTMADSDAYSTEDGPLPFTYTRYADDLIVTAPNRLFMYSAKLVITNIINAKRLSLNPKKIHIIGHNRPMRVTGININDIISISKHRRRRLRAAIHNILTGKTKLTLAKFRWVLGEYAFIGMVNEDHKAKFMDSIAEIKIMMKAHAT
jgi:RNA-directed DNA polymerase